MQLTYSAITLRLQKIEETMVDLRKQILHLKIENSQLKIENSQLKSDNAQLKTQLSLNSKNSSLPPSSDSKANIVPKVPSSPRSYHSGAERTLLPESMVTSREIRIIEKCPRCRSTMELTEESSLWQQIELPPIKPLVHQIELRVCRCPRCDLRVKPQLLPHEAMLLGPRLEGMVNLLMAQFRQGHGPVRDFLATLIPGLTLSQGLISKIKQRAASAFDHATESLTDQILKEQAPKYVDATGWRHQSTNWHTLILRTDRLIRYCIVRHQNSDTVASLLTKGPHWIVSDRGFALGKTSLHLHQYCLAHLLRNIQGSAEHVATSVEEAQTLGNTHELLQGLFHDRHRYEKKEISKSTYLQYSYDKWSAMNDNLTNLAEKAGHSKLKRFCRKALSDWKHFTTYLATDGPMTNNLAEEALRSLVIARKLCFGSRSEYGRNWRERLHSCVETLHRQGKSVLDFLTDTIRSSRLDTPFPTIA